MYTQMYIIWFKDDDEMGKKVYCNKHIIGICLEFHELKTSFHIHVHYLVVETQRYYTHNMSKANIKQKYVYRESHFHKNFINLLYFIWQISKYY